MSLLTVVAADRPGLLAGTAGVLAGEGASIRDATTTVLERSGLALQRIEVAGRGLDAAAWDRIGTRLRIVLGGSEGVALGTTGWRPAPPVTVETQPQGDARCVVTLRAPDRTGLLHAAAAWLTAHGCNVVACHASAEGGHAVDVFVIDGDLDPTALAEALGGGAARRAHGALRPLRVATGLALLPWRVGTAVRRAVADGLPEAP
jgi:predicted amino acid-binding ACT domain protein